MSVGNCVGFSNANKEVKLGNRRDAANGKRVGCGDNSTGGEHNEKLGLSPKQAATARCSSEISNTGGFADSMANASTAAVANGCAIC